MTLAVVRSLAAPRRVGTVQESEDFEQELVDQYLLAAVGAGCADSTVAQDRSVLFEFIRFLGRPVWTALPADADRFLAYQRRSLGRARLTVQHKAWSLAQFYDFLIARHQGDIHALTGYVVDQIIDEFNRPGFCRRVHDQTLRDGLAKTVSRWLPSWNGRLTPHVLRHYCASSLYTQGMDIKAIQELLGHSWLSTTTRYVHVPAEHVDQAWAAANQRTQVRLGEIGGMR